MYLISGTSSCWWPGAGLEPATLWVMSQRATTAPSRDVIFVSAKLWTLFYVSKYSALFFR